MPLPASAMKSRLCMVATKLRIWEEQRNRVNGV
jgi:hypothetical protein